MRFMFGVLLLCCGAAFAAETLPEVKMKALGNGDVQITVVVPASYVTVLVDKLDGEGKPTGEKVAKVLTPAELKAKALQNAQAFIATSLQVLSRTTAQINAERDKKIAELTAAYEAAKALAPKDE